MNVEREDWAAWQGEREAERELVGIGEIIILAFSARLRFDTEGAIGRDGEDEYGAFTLHGTRSGDRLAMTIRGSTWEAVIDDDGGVTRGTWPDSGAVGPMVIRRLAHARRVALTHAQATEIRRALHCLAHSRRRECRPGRPLARQRVRSGREDPRR